MRVYIRETIINGVEHNASTPRKTGPFVGFIWVIYYIYFLPARDFFKGPRSNRHYIIIIIVIIERDVCYYVSLLLDTIIIYYAYSI